MSGKSDGEHQIADLNSLGSKSQAWLNQIGIYNRQQIAEIGPIQVYRLLQKTPGANPSLNMLYALVGALEDRHWQEVAKTDKTRLLTELAAAEEMERDQQE